MLHVDVASPPRFEQALRTGALASAGFVEDYSARQPDGAIFE